jgi:hypothetical protein
MEKTHEHSIRDQFGWQNGVSKVISDGWIQYSTGLLRFSTFPFSVVIRAALMNTVALPGALSSRTAD